MRTLAYSSIKPTLLRAALFKASLFGGIGALFFLFAAFLPLPLIAWMGLPLFCLGLFFIAWGFIPYRKLTYLETNPHEIGYEKGELVVRQGKRLFTIDLETIERIDYVEKEGIYGLTFILKKPLQDIFLPYFSQSAKKAIIETGTIKVPPE